MTHGSYLEILVRISDKLFSNRGIKKRLGNKRVRIVAIRLYFSERFSWSVDRAVIKTVES